MDTVYPSSPSRKRSRPEDGSSVGAEINDVYHSREFLERITNTWRHKETLTDDASGAVLYHHPYQLCILPHFISSSNKDYLQQLTDELLRLKFVEKNNDLYQFRQKFGILGLPDEPCEMTFYTSLVTLSHIAVRLEQTISSCNTASVNDTSSNSTVSPWNTTSINDTSSSSTCTSLELQTLSAVVGQVVADACNYSEDLKKFKSPCVTAFRHLLLDECLPWLRKVTGIELNGQIDITCSKYEFTDNLLCHDDQLEGRRVAFIYYLVSDWMNQDGGTLDLFDTDVNGDPNQIVVSIPPVWNNFIFFEVTPTSFHQVSEVLSVKKLRLSISGWFRGPDIPRPKPALVPTPSMSDPVLADLSTLSEWVSPGFLDVGTLSQIQSQFEVDSQIELPDFLLAEKYEMLCEELESQHCKWALKGPPNKRHVHVAMEESLPSIVTAFMEFLHSEPFCRLLSHLTGLDLAENVIRSDESGGQPCALVTNESTSHESSSSKGKVDGELTPHYQQGSSGNSTSQAKVRGELFSLRPGDYTLVSDQDPTIGECALDLHIHFCCDNWTADYGGMKVYVAKDEDEELLSLCPSRNALSLVFRDEDTISFTKYINHRNTSSNFFVTSFTYQEIASCSSVPGE